LAALGFAANREKRMDSSAKPVRFAANATGTPAFAGSVPRRSADATVVKPAAPSRILVVEDQEDVRRMLATVLEIEGHQVDEAATALEGLRQLRQRRYHLVLSDYAMPGGTGAWMLREATRLGLMDRTVAVILTAYPDVRDLADVAVISKPFDLDYFLEQVRKILTSSRAH